MASEPRGDEPQIATQDSYTEAVEDDDVETRFHETDGGAFEVETVRPLKFLRDAERYGVLAIMSDGDDNEAAVRNAVESGGLSAFMSDTIVPKVVRPTVYWDPKTDLPDDVSEDEAFDLAALDPDDLFGIISAITGQDQADLADQAEELKGNR